MKFVIAGCGIGGLAAALGLAQNGHEVVVLERTPELKPAGAGISLQPNAMQALSRLGLDRKVAAAGYPSKVGRILTANGRTIKEFDFSTSHAERYGWLPVTIHRAALIRVMEQTADHSKIRICLGDELHSFSDHGDGLLARSLSGRTHECDGLIGADGIHSRVRAQLWRCKEPIFAGYTCWRGIASEPSIVEACTEMVECWGRAARFGFMRCSASQVYWFATQSRRVSSKDGCEFNDWKRLFENWAPPVPEILKHTPDHDIVQNDICDRDPIFPWGQGRVTLLGDAAHAMTPNFGQGGAQALEDAVVLAHVVLEHASVETAFRKYEGYRRTRTSRLVRRSRQFGRIAQGGNAWNRFIRDHVLPKFPKRLLDKMLQVQFDFNGHLAGLEER